MGRETWRLITGSKKFYITTYRRCLLVLVGSMAVNIVLLVGVYFVYFSEPERDYYATSGVTPPIQLTAYLTPNYAGNALLPPDPISNDQVKEIPS